MIRLDLPLANFQLTVTSSSRTTSPIFFLSPLNPLTANFQMTVNLFSHFMVYKITSEYNSLPKLSRDHLEFVCRLLIISLENIFSI